MRRRGGIWRLGIACIIRGVLGGVVYIDGEQQDSQIWSGWEVGFWRNDSCGYVCYTLLTVILYGILCLFISSASISVSLIKRCFLYI